MNRKLLKKVFLDTIPVLSGYIVLGIGFGVILMSRGMGLGWSVGMSTIIYAGSMQFLASELISSGASLLSIAVTTFMVNARHFFFGISMVDAYKNTGIAKPYLIYGLTDETYSFVCNTAGLSEQERKPYYFAVTLVNQLYWVLSCALGSLVGSLVKFNTEGVDFALTALFLTVFVEQWLSTEDHSMALTGLLGSFACLVVFGPDNFLIPAMLLITVVLTLMRGRKEGKA